MAPQKVTVRVPRKADYPAKYPRPTETWYGISKDIDSEIRKRLNNTKTILDASEDVIPTAELSMFWSRYNAINRSRSAWMREIMYPVGMKEAEKGYKIIDDAGILYNDVKDSYGKNIARLTKEEADRKAELEAEKAEAERREAWRELGRTMREWTPPVFPAIGIPEFPTVPSGRAIVPEYVTMPEPEYEEAPPVAPPTTWERLTAYVKEHPLQTAGIVILGAVTARIAVPMLTETVARVRKARVKR
jgi:hypothetical protein